MNTTVKSKKKKYLKASTVVVLAASTVATAIPGAAFASGFSDVKVTDFYFDAVKELAARGVINGYPDGTFGPGKDVTRGQAAKMIAGALGLDTMNVINPNFSDVPKTHPYYGPIAALKQAGIIDGYPDGTYRSGTSIERNHMAKIIAEALSLQATDEDSLPFTDVSASYKSYIAALYEHGVTTGRTATSYGGKDPVKRGQMAAFIVRAEKAVAPKADVSFEVQKVEGTTLTTATDSYEISPELASYLNEQNAAALAGATVTATVEKGQITKVSSMHFRASGTNEAAVVFDGANTTFNGDVTVDGNQFELKNITIQKNLTVSNNVTTNLQLTNVNVQGETIVAVNEQQPIASLQLVANEETTTVITLTNSDLGATVVNRSNVTFVSDSTIESLTINNSTNVRVLANVGTLNISAADISTFSGQGAIGELNITGASTGASADATLQWSGTIDTLVTEAPITIVGDASQLTIKSITIPFGKTLEDMLMTEDGTVPTVLEALYPDGTPVNADTGGGGSTGDGGSTGGGGSSTTQFQVKSKTMDLTDFGLDKSLAATAVSSNSEVATAKIEKGSLVVTGVKPGDVTITLNQNGNIASIDVTISTNGEIVTANLIKYSPGTAVIHVNLATLGFINATTASKSNVAKVDVTAEKVTFTAKAPGTEIITISNALGQSAEITVTVNAKGELTANVTKPYIEANPYKVSLSQLGLSKMDSYEVTTADIASAKQVANDIVFTSLAQGTTMFTFKDGKKIANVTLTVDSKGNVVTEDTAILAYKAGKQAVTSQDTGFLLDNVTLENDENIATTSVDIGKLEIVAVNPGTTAVKVKDAVGKVATFKVTVDERGNVSISDKVSYKAETKTVTADVATLGFTGPVSVSTDDTVTVTINEKSQPHLITFTANKPGETVTLTITNENGRTATVTYTVEANGSFKDFSITKFVAQPTKFVTNDVATIGFVANQVTSSTTDVAMAEIVAGKIQITPYSQGTTTLTLNGPEDRKATIVVTVDNKDNVTYKINKYETKTATVDSAAVGFTITENTTDTHSTEDVVTVETSSNQAKFTALKPGTTIVTLTEAKMQSDVKITVDEFGVISTTVIKKYELDEIDVPLTFENIGLNSPTTADVASGDAVAVELKANELTLKAIAIGKSIVSVKDAVGRETTIAVEVDAYGDITHTIKKHEIEPAVISNTTDELGFIATSVVSSTQDIVNVTVEADEIIILPKKAGSAQVVVKDEDNRYATIQVTVQADDSITAVVTQQYKNTTATIDVATLNIDGIGSISTPDSVNVSTANNIITLTATKPTTESVTVTDDTGRVATLNIEVDNYGTITVTSAAFNNDMETIAANIATLGIDNVSLKSSATYVETTIDSGVIKIKSIQPGKEGVIEVIDAAGRVATIPVDVDASGTLTVGMITKFTYSVITVTDLQLQWTTSTTSTANVATISPATADTSAVITAIAPGTTIFIVSDSLGRQATITVTVAANGTIIHTKKAYERSGDIWYEALGDFKAVTISTTSDVVTATLATNKTTNDTIIITAKKDGVATINVVDADSREQTYEVTVVNGEVTMTNETLYLEGQQESVALNIISNTLTNSDEKVATADVANGNVVVTAHKPGTTSIVQTDADGRKGSFDVTVAPTGKIVISNKKVFGENTLTFDNSVDQFGLEGKSTSVSTDDVVSLKLVDNKIVITGEKPGQTDVWVKKNSSMAIIEINVDEYGTVTTRDTGVIKFMAADVEEVDASSLNISDSVESIEFVEGENASSYSAIKKDGKILITGKGVEGSGTIILEGDNGRQALINVVINKAGDVTVTPVPFTLQETELVTSDDSGIEWLASLSELISSNENIVNAEKRGSKWYLVPEYPGKARITATQGTKNAYIDITVSSFGVVTYKVLSVLANPDTRTANTVQKLGFVADYAALTEVGAKTSTSKTTTNETVDVSVKDNHIEIVPKREGNTVVYLSDADRRVSKLSISVNKVGEVTVNVQKFDTKTVVTSINALALNLTLDNNYEISTSNYATVTLNADGFIAITPIKPGTDEITVTDRHGRASKIEVTVSNFGAVNATPEAYTFEHFEYALQGLTFEEEDVESNKKDRIEVKLTTNDTVEIKPKEGSVGATDFIITVIGPNNEYHTVKGNITTNDVITIDKDTEVPYTVGDTTTVDSVELNFEAVTISALTTPDVVTATIDSGTVVFNALKPGESEITVSNDGKETVLTIIVKNNGKLVVEPKEGETYQLEQQLTYVNSREKFALIATNVTVDSAAVVSAKFETITTGDGATVEQLVIEALKPGTATVTVSNSPFRETKIHVEVNQYGIIEETSVDKHTINPQEYLLADYGVANPTTYDSASPDTAITEIKDGKLIITPQGTGSTVITLIDDDGRTAIIPITVEENDDIVIDSENLQKYIAGVNTQIYNQVEPNLGTAEQGKPQIDYSTGFEATDFEATIVTATFDTVGSEKVVKLTAVKPGKEAVKLFDETGKVTTVNVEVDMHGNLTILSIVQFKEMTSTGISFANLGINGVENIGYTTNDVIAIVKDTDSIKYTSKKPGTTKVTLKDSTGKEAYLTITVKDDGTMTVPIVEEFGYTNLSLNPLVELKDIKFKGFLLDDSNSDVSAILKNGLVVIVAPLSGFPEGVIIVSDKTEPTSPKRAEIHYKVNANGKFEYTVVPYIENDQIIVKASDLGIEYNSLVGTYDTSKVDFSKNADGDLVLTAKDHFTGALQYRVQDEEGRQAIVKLNMSSTGKMTYELTKYVDPELKVKLSDLKIDENSTSVKTATVSSASVEVSVVNGELVIKGKGVEDNVLIKVTDGKKSAYVTVDVTADIALGNNRIVVQERQPYELGIYSAVISGSELEITFTEAVTFDTATVEFKVNGEVMGDYSYDEANEKVIITLVDFTQSLVTIKIKNIQDLVSKELVYTKLDFNK